MTDNPLRPALFREAPSPRTRRQFNDAMVGLMTGLPEWWNVGAEATREARRQGRGPFPPPVMSPRARTIVIAGRDGNEIPLRIIAPGSGARRLSAHPWRRLGAGCPPTSRTRCWSISPTAPAWRWSASNTGWRRNIPIRPGPDDCESAAAWLVKNAKAEFGSDVLTIGGKSAGGHLSAVTILRMRDRYGYTGFRGANLVYGAFDLSMTPSQRGVRRTGGWCCGRSTCSSSTMRSCRQ